MLKNRIGKIKLILLMWIVGSFFGVISQVQASFSDTVCEQTNESALGIPSSECLVLKDLYDRTGGDNWSNNDNWGTITNVATWQGVTLSSGHVNGITLNSNNLNGNVGTWNIGGLPEMWQFYLQNNQLTGDISSWNIASLDSLAGFSVFGNQLTGDLSFANWDISNLTGLYYFYLNENNFTGDISSWDLSKLIHLTHFVLRGNNFTGDLSSWDISNLTALDYFYLNENNFTGDLSSWDISNLTALRVFFINNNHFTGNIPDFDANGMLYFVTNDNAFTFSNLEPRIVKINSVGTHTYNPQVKIDTNNRLVNVDVDNTLTITPELPLNSSGNDSYEWFKDGVSLGASSTSNRIFTKDNVTSADAGIYTYRVTNSNVPDLVLESNNIIVTIVEAGDTTKPQLAVINNVMTPTNDTTPNFVFSTDENGTVSYSGSCAGDINTAIIGNNIVNLIGSDGNPFNNGIYSDCTITVTDALGNISDPLQINTFTVDTSISFPSSVCDQSNENILGISSTECNTLKNLYDSAAGDNWNDNSNWGTISDVNTWSNVAVNNNHITKLNLNNNNLSGNINLNFSNLSNLTDLRLDNNQLTGDISSWDISGLTNLDNFNLDNNQLTGDISSWNISGLTGLVSFQIRNNQLTGDISSWDISNLIVMKYFDIGQNNFTGNIGSWNISALTNLRGFYVRNNQFIGDISSWDISNLNNLNLFYLENNQLTGDISSWDMSNCTQMREFVVSHNNLFGNIPDFSTNNMNYFEIENNKFIFSNIEPRISKINQVGEHTYYPQDNVDSIKTINVDIGNTLTITPELPLNSSGNDSYEWFKDGVSLGASSTSNRIFTKDNVTSADAGIYTYRVTNSNVPELNLESRNITVNINSPTIIRADVDQNSLITILDSFLTLRKSFDLIMDETDWYNSQTTGDVNCDNISNSTDAMLILRRALNLSVNNTWCDN